MEYVLSPPEVFYPARDWWFEKLMGHPAAEGVKGKAFWDDHQRFSVGCPYQQNHQQGKKDSWIHQEGILIKKLQE